MNKTSKFSFHKIIALFCTGILIISLAACKNNTTPVTKVDFWSTYATEKVLQAYPKEKDSTKGEFKGPKFDAKIDIFAARGEYESAQIIMSAKTAVESYDVSIGDLSSSKGTFSKDNVIVYHQKYIDVLANFENNGAPVGMYPDAIVPLWAIKNYGQNNVAAGKNQGIYFTFNVPSDQAPGLYTGTFKVTYDGKTQDIPVKLLIEDLTVSSKVRSKNIFLSQWNYQAGELNGSQEMYDAYTDKLIEYRLAPQYLVTDSVHSQEDIEYYTEKAYEYLQNERLSNISIPYQTKYVPAGQPQAGELTIDGAVFARYLNAFIEKSFETGFDLLAKSNVYFNIIDEPDSQGLLERTKAVYADYKNTLTSVAKQLRENTIIPESDFKTQIIKSVENLPEVIPCYYSDAYKPYIDTFVPGVSGFLKYYDELKAHQEDLWWYTCVGPRAPEPTYHIEDSLVSARAMSWMQAEYGIVGNLYWSVNLYSHGNGVNGYWPLDDYYGMAGRYPQVNGDGFLFYPGGQYGIDEPVGSVRLEAIRDGLEEFEIGLDCEDVYNEISEVTDVENNWRDAMSRISRPVYHKTIVVPDSEIFYNARRNFYNFAKMTLGPANVVVTKFEDDGYGKVNYELYANDGYEIKINGQVPQDQQIVQGGKIFKAELLRADVRDLVVSVEVGGETLSYYDSLGGAVIAYHADQFENSFSKGAGVANVSTNLIDAIGGGDFVSGLRGFFLQLKVEAMPNIKDTTKYNIFQFDHDFMDELGTDTNKVEIYLYNKSATKLTIQLRAKFSNSYMYIDIGGDTLAANSMTKVVIPYSEWAVYGSIEYLLFHYENQGAANDSIYLHDIVVTEN